MTYAASEDRCACPLDLSIVTTLDLARRPEQLLERLHLLYNFSSGAGFRLVVGHNDRGTRHDVKLRRWHDRHAGTACTLASQRFYAGEVNNACLRNAALGQVATPIVVLMDADIYLDREHVERLAHAVASGTTLAMLPCLYLTNAGTQILLSGGAASALIDDYFNYRRHYVMHLAMPSSVIAFKTSDALGLGGFHEGYTGHGYEDFDFMLRLARNTGLINGSADLLLDKSYAAPLLAEGFRAHLGGLCLREMIEKRFAFHLFHCRDNSEQYYALREKNRSLFQSRIASAFGMSPLASESATPPLIDQFFALCRVMQRQSDDYFACFDARPGYLVRTSRVHRMIQRLTRGPRC